MAIATSFKITLLKASRSSSSSSPSAPGAPASSCLPAWGALAALILVILLGVAIRGPLSRVPENTLKFVVGTLLSAFGTFWFGEGIGASWPTGDLAIVILTLAFAIVAVAAARAASRSTLSFP